MTWFPGLRFDAVPFRVSRGLGFGNGFRERGWLNMVYGCRGFRVDLVIPGFLLVCVVFWVGVLRGIDCFCG